MMLPLLVFVRIVRFVVGLSLIFLSSLRITCFLEDMDKEEKEEEALIKRLYDGWIR